MKRSRVQPWENEGSVVSRARNAAAAGRRDSPSRRDAQLLAGRLERLRQALPELGERVELAEEVEDLAVEPATQEEALLGGRLAGLLALRACGRGVASVVRG